MVMVADTDPVIIKGMVMDPTTTGDIMVDRTTIKAEVTITIISMVIKMAITVMVMVEIITTIMEVTTEIMDTAMETIMVKYLRTSMNTATKFLSGDELTTKLLHSKNYIYMNIFINHKF